MPPNFIVELIKGNKLFLLVRLLLMEVEVAQVVGLGVASDHADVIAQRLLLQELLGQVLREKINIKKKPSQRRKGMEALMTCIVCVCACMLLCC